MKNQKIAFDCDGVLAQWDRAFINYLNKNLGTDFKLQDITNYSFYKESPKFLEKARSHNLEDGWFVKYLAMFTKQHHYLILSPYPGMQETIGHLTKSFDLAIITDRIKLDDYPLIIEQDTIDWLRQNFGNEAFPNSRIHFTNGKSKALICSELGYNVLVEDKYENAFDHVSLKQENTAFLVDRTYNQGQEVPRLNRIYGRDNPLAQCKILVNKLERTLR